VSPIMLQAGVVNVGESLVEVHEGWTGRLAAAAQMVDLFAQLFEPALDGPKIRIVAEAHASWLPNESKAVLAALDTWIALEKRCVADGP
jgi:hypothetical protein